MPHQQLPREIQKLGLTEKESKVYLAALELGFAPIQDISGKSGINRATTYVIMDQLIAKGLASHFNKGKKRFFTAEAPDQLLGLLRIQERELSEKKREFERILPELRSLNNLSEHKPKVLFYEGVEGIRAIMNDFLTHPSDELLGLSSEDEFQASFAAQYPQEYRTDYIDRRHKIKKSFRGVYTAKKPLDPSEISSLDSLRWLSSDKHDFSSDITIYGDRVAIVSYRTRLVGIIIENPEYVAMMRTIFEMVWGISNIDPK